jgi:hypothetical protein
MKTCEFCGAQFEVKTRGRMPLYCSQLCKDGARQVLHGWADKETLLRVRRTVGTVKTCLNCHNSYTITRTNYTKRFCSDTCRAQYHYKNNMATGRHRASHLKRNYGLTTDDYAAMFHAQGGVCAICGRKPPPGKNLYVDHDHKTTKVRGLLCNACNQTLGWVDANLTSILKYLKIR